MVAVVEGLKVLTPVLDSKHYERERHVTVTVLNLTSDALRLEKNKHVVVALICQAAKLTGNILSG